MKKRLFAGLLTAALLLGMIPPIPTQAVGADAGTGNGATEEVVATDVTGGTYTDTTADPNATYEYVIEGSDGSREVVNVEPTIMENTGNSVVNNGPLKYVKTALNNITDGKYLILGARDNCRGWAIKPDVNCPWDKRITSAEAEKDEFSGNHSDLEWSISKVVANGAVVSGKYHIQTADGKYMKVSHYDSQDAGAVIVEEANDKVDKPKEGVNRRELQIEEGDNHVPAPSVAIRGAGKAGNYGYLNRRGETYLGTWTGKDEGSSFYLFKKTGGFYLNLAGLKALVEQAAHYKEMNDVATGARRYTSTSWTKFQEAKTAAQAIVDANVTYPDQTSAEQALRAANEAYTNLWNAILNLEPEVARVDNIVQAGEVAVPSIIWQRTLEYNNQDNGDLVVDLQHISSSNLNKIKWNWSDVAGLTTNPTMTVWDYNTDYQYSPVAQNQPQDVVAATWGKYSTNHDWTKSTVRKFSGEFKWPEGYDLEDTAKFVSVNDANYDRIYKYIEGKKTEDPALYERYKNATVIPINDDMYVLMYKDQDGPKTTDVQSFTDRLVFWSGTSGKGKWSDPGKTEDDWNRSVPAVFGTDNAIPAFHGHRPNVKHLDPNAGVEALTDETKAKLDHTDTWYTMVDTSAVMSKMNAVYGKTGIQAGQKMHVDIYCFNNSSDGGMDQLELKFVKRQQKSAKVQVNYFLDSVGNENYLGSTYMADVAVGTEITLQKGTGIHNLNHKKALATERAGAGVVVSDGVQRVTPYVVVPGKINHINVVYTRQTDYTTDYTYDFGAVNEYTHPLANQNQGDTITSVTLKNAPKGMAVDYTPGQKQCKITYTPQDAKREQVVGILEVAYTTGGTAGKYTEAVNIYPASNVLYEQEYFTPAQGSKWTMKNHDGQTATETKKTVADNMSTVYGYTEGYNAANPENLVYTAEVDATAANMVTGQIDTTIGGNGFDLIGSCGPNTGTLAVRVSDRAGNVVKSYVVDTRFTDEKYQTIHHVPLVHCQLDTVATYNISVQGVYINYGSNGGAKTMSMNGNDGSDRMEAGQDPVSQIYDVLYDMGLTEEDINNVEFVNVGDNLDATTYAVNEADRVAAPTTPVAPEKMTLSLDGIRVYGSTTNVKYAEAEKNLTYKNVIDCIKDQQFGAYAEPNGSVPGGNYTAANYEALGGPENEVYLENPDSALVLAEAKQVSLRSVTGAPIQVSINGEAAITVTSPVEMYYTVTGNPETAGTTTIKKVDANNNTNTLLAIGNVKHAGTMAPVTAEQYASAFALLSKEVPGPGESVKPEQPETPQNPEETYFVPEKFDVRMDTVKIGRRTKVTITAETSKDVEYITVNGKKVKASNDKTTLKGFLQNLFDKLTGKAENPDVRKFVFTKRYPTKKLEGMNHEVISYNKDQLASKPVIAEEVSK